MILSFSLSASLSLSTTTSFLEEYATAFPATLPPSATNRNIPFLWLGPNAAGHRKPPRKIPSEGNNALWHFTHEMGNEARKREVEVLDLWNVTVQAGSWDGSGYGVKVALVEAMMVSLAFSFLPPFFLKKIIFSLVPILFWDHLMIITTGRYREGSCFIEKFLFRLTERVCR